MWISHKIMHQIWTQMWKFLSHSQKWTVFCCTNKWFLLTECQWLPENGILILPAEWSLFSVWRMSYINTTRICRQYCEMWNLMSIKNGKWFQENVIGLLNTAPNSTYTSCTILFKTKPKMLVSFIAISLPSIANMPISDNGSVEDHSWFHAIKWPVVPALFIHHYVKH